MTNKNMRPSGRMQSEDCVFTLNRRRETPVDLVISPRQAYMNTSSGEIAEKQ